MSLAISPRANPQQVDLFAGYQPLPGVYDEMFAAPGELRPQWRQFVTLLNAMGRVELGRRWEQAQRLIRENGVTYNVHGDAEGKDRPWELDAIPLLLPGDEWSALSTGLAQRARLLNLILADIYGPQTLVAGGHLPPELIFAHAGFLRPCHRIHVPDQTFLSLYAAHLARSAETGNWVVLSDRTQSPLGAGYAVENRIVISRMLPNKYRDCRVERLASFFISVREALHGLAAHHRENPWIVLLSPGPASPTYFEDAYLARYLGYTLVEGGDLTVRDQRVYLKTLGGLIQVDVILRRVPDDHCDPLELRGGSRAGVPGLLQAVRGGNVVVANALGSGLLEAPALLAFFPRLARHLIGEELRIPSVATWWCGQPAELTHVLENIEQLVIKPAFSLARTRPIVGGQLSRGELTELIERIKARPRNYVGQQWVTRSTAPVMANGGVQPWHVALRAFLVAADGSYQVMPGGLTRVSAAGDRLGDSMLAGEGSKDVWVLSEGPVAPVSLLQSPETPVPLRRSGNDLPSRVADNLYWLGRHVERAEGAVRLLRSIVLRLAGESDPANLPELTSLLHALAEQGQIRPEFIVYAGGKETPIVDREILAFIFDPQRAGSLRSTVDSVRHVASIVRDRISLDSWRILNRVEQDFLSIQTTAAVQLSDVLSMLNQMIVDLSAFSGVGTESMTRGPGWRFLDMGRRIERAQHTISLLRSTLVADGHDENPVLEALLEIADSSMTYRNRYLTTLRLAPVLDLLMTDETNPRSVGFQLVALSGHVENLPRDQAEPLFTAEQRTMLGALASLRLADVAQLSQLDREGSRRHLDRLLSRLAQQLRALSDGISHKYLVHAGPSRQLAEIRPSAGAKYEVGRTKDEV
ncbi:MAG TPA: circularly permuted type 2 ATP-grasp protein [Pirellulales bacterium]|nr:circularly permuted type 2 ATP-grasp protein [Pirellulales bacterium]